MEKRHFTSASLRDGEGALVQGLLSTANLCEYIWALELPIQGFNADKRDEWNNTTFTVEEAWCVFFGTMAP